MFEASSRFISTFIHHTGIVPFPGRPRAQSVRLESYYFPYSAFREPV